MEEKKTKWWHWLVGLIVLGWIVDLVDGDSQPPPAPTQTTAAPKTGAPSSDSVSDLARRRAVKIDDAPEEIPSKEAIDEQEDPVAEALNILRQTERLIEKGKAMERLRQTNDTALLTKCGEQMRELQPAARVLADDAMKLPLEIRADVTAPAEAVMCVSWCAQHGRPPRGESPRES